MSSAHLIDPEIKFVLEILPKTEWNAATLPAIRQGFEELAAGAPPAENPAVTVEEKFIAGGDAAPAVRVLIYRPVGNATGLPAYLHMHGGGYVIGAPDASAAANTAMVAECGCVVVTVDYRLAPETSHPGPLEDCYAALRWLYDHAAELGVDRRRIGIGGESAGGGLAAALALLARDRGQIEVRFQHLIYPMIDDRTCVEAQPNPFAGEFIWTRAQNEFGWAALLGQPPGGADVSPYAAAARAENLAGLPPAFIATGALDLFIDENLEYARRLIRAGVAVELHVYPGAFHGFHLAAEAAVTIRAKHDSLAALRRAFARG